MKWKFRVRKLGKFQCTSQGGTLLVGIQENDVPIVTDNFRMESTQFYNAFYFVSDWPGRNMPLKLEKRKHVTCELAFYR